MHGGHALEAPREPDQREARRARSEAPRRKVEPPRAAQARLLPEQREQRRAQVEAITRQIANAAQANPGSTGTNFQVSCGTENISQLTSKPIAQIIGNKTPATSCANQQIDAQNLLSKYYMKQAFFSSSTAGNKGWNQHVCVAYRGSTDAASAMKGIAVG